MTKSISLICFILAPIALGSNPALAGVGEVNAHIKAQNAICEAQKRGEGPAYPNMCLPEYPPYDDPHVRADKR